MVWDGICFLIVQLRERKLLRKLMPKPSRPEDVEAKNLDEAADETMDTDIMHRRPKCYVSELREHRRSFHPWALVCDCVLVWIQYVLMGYLDPGTISLIKHNKDKL